MAVRAALAGEADKAAAAAAMVTVVEVAAAAVVMGMAVGAECQLVRRSTRCNRNRDFAAAGMRAS